MNTLKVELIEDSYPYIDGNNGIGFSLWDQFCVDSDIEYERFTAPSFNSVANHIADGELDVGVGPFSVTSERKKLVDYTRPFSISEVSVFYKEKRLIPYSYIAIVALIVLIITVIISLITKESLFVSFYKTFSSFLKNDPIVRRPRQTLDYNLNLVWITLSFIFFAGSVSYITSLFLSYQEGPRNRESLKGMKIAHLEGTYFNEIITSLGAIPVSVPTLQDGFARVEADEVDGYLDDRHIARFAVDTSSYSESEVIRAEEYCFIMRKGNGLREKFNKWLVNAREIGVTEKYCRQVMGRYEPFCQL